MVLIFIIKRIRDQRIIISTIVSYSYEQYDFLLIGYIRRIQ